MKKILLISTGGTIASMPTDEGLTPKINSKKLLEYLNFICLLLLYFKFVYFYIFDFFF